MVKILSQSGNSLADTYDVKGSVAGIEELETRELPIVHEMGATVFSERYSSFIRGGTSGAINQSVNFNTVLDDLPAGVWRILGISVFTDAAARTALCSVALRNPTDGREIPLWAWDTTPDIEVLVRFSDDGAAVTNRTFLRPVVPFNVLPHLASGGGQPQRVNEIAFRGQASAFGAGTVEIQMLLHIGFAAIGGVSSRGLPVPSW